MSKLEAFVALVSLSLATGNQAREGQAKVDKLTADLNAARDAEAALVQTVREQRQQARDALESLFSEQDSPPANPGPNKEETPPNPPAEQS